jgi:hypothetical protein
MICKPEPVVWWNGAAKFASPAEKNWDKRTGGILSAGCDTPLYTAPPQREWQGLTDYEHLMIWTKLFNSGDREPMQIVSDALAMAEAKLKEKNT